MKRYTSIILSILLIIACGKKADYPWFAGSFDDAKANAGAHRVLAFLNRVDDGFAILGGNCATGHKLINQFVNRLPAIGGLQRWHDVIGLYYFA